MLGGGVIIVYHNGNISHSGVGAAVSKGKGD